MSKDLTKHGSEERKYLKIGEGGIEGIVQRMEEAKVLIVIMPYCKFRR